MNQLQYSSTKSFAEKTRLECENEMLEQDLENLKMIQHTKDTEIKKIQQDHDHEITLLKQALTLLKQEKDVLNRQLNNNSDKKQTNTSQPKDTNNQDDPKDEHVTAMKKDSKDVESSEVESNTLRVSLENAHIMVRALQKQIQDEVSERCEVNQLLREAQETIETFRNSSLAIQPPQWTSHQNQQGELSSPRNDADSPSKSDDWDQPYIGQSLGDELYQFYNSSSTDKCGQDNAIDDCKTPCNIQDQSDPNEPVTLVCEPQTNVHDTKPEEFGTLIKEPESFIYRPTGNYNGDSIVSENNRANTCHLTEADNLPQMESESSFQNIDKSHLLAIAITMAGNWAWKYKRKLIGKGISSNKHCRFVWIHPYSRTLYWSEMEPGSKGSEYKTKTGKSPLKKCSRLC